MQKMKKESLCGIMAKVLNCSFKVSEFDFQSYNYIHFPTNILEKGMNPLNPLAMG